MFTFDDLIDVGAMGLGRFWTVLLAEFTCSADDYNPDTATRWTRDSIRWVDVPALSVTDRQWVEAIIG